MDDALSSQTQYTYDLVDRLTERTDARGLGTTYEYELATDRLIRMNHLAGPETPGETVEYTYDKLGRRTQVSVAGDPEPAEKATYDLAGRLLTLEDCCGAKHEYQYDLNGNRTSYIRYRQNGQTWEPSWQVSYAYDELNRLIQMERTEGADVQTAKYHYDLAGRLARMDYPKATWVEYSYDNLDRITRLANMSATGAFCSFHYQYDNLSRRTKISREDGTWTEYGYNTAGWLTRESRYAADADLSWQDQYEYDLVGNRTKKIHADAAGSMVVTYYAYNAGSQLVQERSEIGTGILGEVWDDESGLASLAANGEDVPVSGTRFLAEVLPDASGNVRIIAQDNVGNVTTIVKHADFVANGTIDYDYDGNGNVVSMTEGTDVTTYSWDHENKMVGVALPSGDEIEYAYCKGCSLGNLATKTIHKADGGVQAVQWIWDGVNIVAEVDGRSNSQTDYFLDPSGMIGNVVGVKKDGEWIYPAYDAMGTIFMLRGTDGAMAEARDFDAWGVSLPSSGLQPPSSTIVPIGWQTKPWDDETGLWYSRARWYDARLGRFMSVDPVLSARGRGSAIIVYGYGNGSPMLFADPAGAKAMSIAEAFDVVQMGNLSDVGVNSLLCISWAECRFDPSRTSNKGASGMMQMTSLALTDIADKSRLPNGYKDWAGYFGGLAMSDLKGIGGALDNVMAATMLLRVYMETDKVSYDDALWRYSNKDLAQYGPVRLCERCLEQIGEPITCESLDRNLGKIQGCLDIAEAEQATWGAYLKRLRAKGGH